MVYKDPIGIYVPNGMMSYVTDPKNAQKCKSLGIDPNLCLEHTSIHQNKHYCQPK